MLAPQLPTQVQLVRLLGRPYFLAFQVLDARPIQGDIHPGPLETQLLFVMAAEQMRHLHHPPVRDPEIANPHSPPEVARRSQLEKTQFNAECEQCWIA